MSYVSQPRSIFQISETNKREETHISNNYRWGIFVSADKRPQIFSNVIPAKRVRASLDIIFHLQMQDP